MSLFGEYHLSFKGRILSVHLKDKMRFVIYSHISEITNEIEIYICLDCFLYAKVITGECECECHYPFTLHITV